MRDILFRGKRIDNGEWVEGDFVHLPHGSEHFNFIVDCHSYEELKAVIR